MASESASTSTATGVSSNTTLRNHIAHPHCEAKKAQQNQNLEAGQTSMARDESVFSEYERYVNSDFVTRLHPKEFASFDVLGFWKEKETMFPVLSRMAMDIISVQASSVASESAFSTSGRVLSIRRTRLTPASLEMCMCLKDHLDAKERKQDKCPLETPLDFEEGVFDDEVQQNEAIPLSDKEITLDASSEGTMSSKGPRKEGKEEPNSEAGQTSMARDGSVFRYDLDYLREQFAGLVIQRALPFNHFDHEQTTRVFQNTMQPRYTHVSRSTLKRDAMKLWLAAKQEIIDSFGNINACVNLTTDVWSAPHGVPGSYMCVTAHWIEPGTWQMMKRVISFEEFPSPHTGGALFKMLTKVLTNFNLEDKVMLVTLDNASNNLSAMDKLKLKYDPPIGGVGLVERKENKDVFRLSRMPWITWTLKSVNKTNALLKHHFEEDVFDDEVQRNEAIPLSDEKIAPNASSEGTMSPGGPRYDYMMSSEEAEDDY
ncbi:zinc finger BED domain-containing protein RICESLEEPER 2-like protein [Tanacetum coccineum]